MPWQVPITVDGLEYPVTFNTEGEPSQQDYDDAVQQILSQKAQAAPAPEQETPGYLSQLGSALGLGYRQMKSGVGATFNALTGDMPDVAAEMAEMSKLQREQQALQTPEDVAFMRGLDEAEKSFDKASGPLETIGALAEYPAAVLAQPGAAFKTAVQSAPNALISGATSLAGYGLGGLVGGAAGIETGPGAILTGIAGAMAGGAVSNTLMEAGPAIFDVLNERTQGAASNMTADEISAYLQQNPDVVDEGMKTGAIRGSVIGAIEALGVKGSGRLLTMPERAAARAVQKELVAAGVDVASKEAVDQALLDPALKATTKAAAEAAKSQFSSAGNIARLTGAAAIDTGSAGVGEIAAQAAAGQDISTKEAFMEMLGDAALSLPMAAATKTVEGAQYMFRPEEVAVKLSSAAANDLNNADSPLAAEAEDKFTKVVEGIVKSTEPAVSPVKTAEAVEPEVTGIEPTSSISDYDVDEVADTWLSTQPKGMAESIAKNAQQAVNENRPFFGGFLDENGNLVLGRFAAYRQALRRIGKDVDINNPIGDLQRWKKSGVKNYPIIDYVPTSLSQISSVTPSLPETEMQSVVDQEAPAGTPVQAATISNQFPGITAMAAEAAAKLSGGGRISPGLQAAIPQQTPQENAVQKQIPSQSLLREERPEMELPGMGEGNAQPEEVAAEGREEEVITPSGTPTLATEGTPTSRDVGTERDATKPEQMTPDEFDKFVFESGREEYLRTGKPAPMRAGKRDVISAAFSKNEPVSVSLFEAEVRNHYEKISDVQNEISSIENEPESPGSRKSARLSKAKEKLKNLQRSALGLPAGYVLNEAGDLYVFQPGATDEPVQAAPPAAQAVKATAPGPVSGEKPTTLDLARQELEQARGVKPNWAPKAERFAQIYEGEDIRPEIAAKNGEALMSAIQNKQWTDLLHPDNKVSRKVWKEWTGKALPVGLKASQKAFKDFLDAAYPSSQQTTAAEKQTPAPSRKGAGAAGVTERQPSGGSIPEVTPSETQETQPSTKENDAITKEDRDREAEEIKDGQKVRRARKSVIDPAKTNIEYDKVTTAIVESARRQLQNSGEIPNAILTRIYASPEAFLADRSNQRYFPAAYARIMAEPNVEGLYADKTTFVFASNVGVSDLDRGIAEARGISAEQAAARRVIAHENGHRGVDLFEPWELREFRSFVNRTYTTEEIDNLVRLYTEFADWRTNPVSRNEALEEIFQKKFERLVKIPTGGIWDDIVQFLKRVWRRLTGRKGDPTLQDMKDVVRLLRNAMRRTTVPSFTTKDGGEVKLSLSDDKRYVVSLSPSEIDFAAWLIGGPMSDTYAMSEVLDREVSEVELPFIQGNELIIIGDDFAEDAYYRLSEQMEDMIDDYKSNGASSSDVTKARKAARSLAGKIKKVISSNAGFSRVEYASDYSAASSAGAQLARDTVYDDRIIEMRDAIRRAYEQSNTEAGVAMPLDDLYAKAKELAPDMTENEFGNILQDLYEDNGAVLQEGESAFDVFTPEGRRAGFAVIMPKRAVASRVETEGEAVKNFQEGIEAIESNSLNAFSKARPMEGADAEIYTVKPSKFYKQVANDFVNKLIDEGNSIESIGESLFSEDFLQKIGIKNNMPALVMLVAVVKDRVSKQSRDRGTTGARQVKLQKLDRKLAGYWQNLGTNSGRAQGIRSYITKSPEFSWMFIFDRANENLEKEGKLAATRVASDLPQTAETLQKTDAKAGEDAGEQVADDLEDNQDAIDLAEGEATLDQKGKTLWEKFKDLIRKRGIAMRALNALRAGNKAKASISSEERNAISQMSEEELVKFIAGIDKEMAGVFDEFTKTPATRKKREKMVATAKKRAEQGKSLDVSKLEGESALAEMIRAINQARPGEKAPLKKQIPWRKLLSQKASTVEIYRQRIFDAISSEESLANLDDAQRNKLADLFTQAWESKRKAILDRMVDNAINQEQAAGRLTKEGADALRSQRQKLVEDINLGILDEDRLMKHLADKFGIKSEFTEAERANIDRLLDILQDDKLNEVKRNKAGYELLEALSASTKIPFVKWLADLWVTAVLSGLNTAASIAMAVANGGFELTVGVFRVLRAGFTNPKEVPAEIEASFKAMYEFLKAFGREGRLAWQYLVTGDRALLDPSLHNFRNDLNYESIGKTVSLAEKMAKSDKVLEKVMGIWMRSVSRLLSALDNFNTGVTKAGALPIVFRQLNLSGEDLQRAAEKYNLKLYREKAIQEDFNNKQPTNQHEKALVDSYAKARMMADLQEFGKFSENADFIAQNGAMTLDPTGVGGAIYSGIKYFTGGATTKADKFLADAQREWNQVDGADKTAKGLQLAFAYIRQFIAYNSANLAGLRFARFAGNKFNQGLSFIPGIGMFRMYEATVKDSKIEAKEAFTDMILRNQTAGLLFAIIGGMAIKAIMDEPDDEKRGFFWNGGWANLTPDQKQQKLASGQKEYTIGIPGVVAFNYQNWPPSSVFAAIGSLSDLVRHSPEQWNEKSITDRLVSAAASGVFSAGEIPALSGFQTLFGNNLSSKDPNEKRLDRFAKVMAGWGGGFVPRILKDIDFMTDPGLRKYESLWEQTASHIPVYRRYSGKEYYDILGKQIERKVWPGSREFMELETEPEYRTLGKLNSRGIWLTPANAEHRMVGKGRNKRKLTQEEADAYSLETGKGYRQMLLRYGSRLEQMPTERARAFLMDKADEVRDRALKKIVR